MKFIQNLGSPDVKLPEPLSSAFHNHRQLATDTLFEFLSEEDKKHFIEWNEEVVLTFGTKFVNSLPVGTTNIVASFIRRFSKPTNPDFYTPENCRRVGLSQLFVPLDEYELKLKQNLRASQIDSIFLPSDFQKI